MGSMHSLLTISKRHQIGGWGEESATGKSVSVSFRVRVVRAVRASGRGEAA